MWHKITDMSHLPSAPVSLSKYSIDLWVSSVKHLSYISCWHVVDGSRVFLCCDHLSGSVAKSVMNNTCDSISVLWPSIVCNNLSVHPLSRWCDGPVGGHDLVFSLGICSTALSCLVEWVTRLLSSLARSSTSFSACIIAWRTLCESFASLSGSGDPLA